MGFLIAAPLACLLTVAPAPGTSAFHGCEATPIGDEGWSYKCATFTATIRDRSDGVTMSELEGAQAAALGALGDGATAERLPGKLFGQAVDLRRLTRPDKGAHAWVTSLKKSEGARLIACVAIVQEDPCSQVLELLAAARWRGPPISGSVAMSALTLSLGGAEVRAPKGCEGKPGAASGSGNISCPPGYLASWMLVPNAEMGERMMEQLLKTMASRLGVPARDEVECSLRGVPARCVRLLVQVETQKLIVLATIAELRGALTLAFCMAPNEAPMRTPCSFLFGPR
jgi:hypothetical protein